MTSLYVCLFSTGCIKVGRTENPKRRIVAHANNAFCMGVNLVQHSIFTCTGSPLISETKLIKRCRDAASEVRYEEWFFGLDYESVCKWAHEESLKSHVFSPCNEVAQMLDSIKTVSGMTQMEIAKRLGISQPTVGRLLRGQNDPSIETYFAIKRMHNEVTQQPAAA